MIRPSNLADRVAIETIATAIGFEQTEIAEVLSSFDQAHGAECPSQALWLVDDQQGIHAMAYVEPERMTDGTYNLLLLAVHPQHQRQGRGTALIRYVEQHLAALGAHLLLVETMGTEDFSHVRQLYARLGFTEEARIRDFYGKGYDKVVYWKSLK